jgi:hypothetical protein
MKKWILGLMVLIVLAGPLHAGGIGPMLAYWDSSDAEDDQGAGVRVTVDLGPDWNLELRTAWLDSFSQVGDGILFRIEAFPVDLGLSYGFGTEGKVDPYVGVGLTYLDINPIVVDTEIRRRIEVLIPEEIGFHLMAGVDFPIMNDRLSLFAEAIYRSIKAKANSTDIRDFNTEMSGIGANFGLMLNF